MKKILLSTLLMIVFLTQGKTADSLVVAFNYSPPFVITEGENLEGPSVWLMKQLEAELGLTTRYVEMPLDSILGSLAKGNVDLSVIPLTITSDRAAAFDFSPPYFVAHSGVLVNRASALQKAWQFLASFFSINFFRALGALALVILIFGFLAWFFERKENAEEFSPGWKGLWQGFWWSAVTMTTVGYGDKSPRTTGGRIVALVWMFTAIIIISGFTAGIASSLTVNRLSWAQNRIEDFKDKTLGTIDQSGTDQWLIRNFYTDKRIFSNQSDLLEALQNGEIDAVAYDRPLLKEFVRTDSMEQYEMLPIQFNPQYYAMGMNRELSNSLKIQLSTSILEIAEGTDWKVALSEYGLVQN